MEEKQPKENQLKENQPKSDKKSNKKKVYAVLSGLFGLGFIACIIWLIAYAMDVSKADKQLEELKDAYVVEEISGDITSSSEASSEAEASVSEAESSQAESSPQEETVESTDLTTESVPEEGEYPGLVGYDVPEKTIDFDALRTNENEHIYAWITLPGTKIDYPVVQHPESNEYYLNHNLDGSKGYPGCIYTELYNSKEWDDNNTVLYGHNMKNGSMFAGLHYFADSQFFENNRYVYIYTDEKVMVYQIFAAYEFGNAHLLLSFDMDNDETFAEYLEGIMQIDGMNCNFDRELEVTAEDRIITLETCVANKDDRRYIVQAVLVAEGTN